MLTLPPWSFLACDLLLRRFDAFLPIAVFPRGPVSTVRDPAVYRGREFDFHRASMERQRDELLILGACSKQELG